MSYSIAILAAGKSSRFGDEKTLANINNQTLISKIICEAKRTNCADVFVITKSNKFIIHEVKKHNDVKIIINENNTGIASSIKLALKNISDDYILFVNADQYFVNSKHLSNLANEAIINQKHCFTRVNKQLTSPTVICKKQIVSIERLTGDRGLKDVLIKEKNDFIFYDSMNEKLLIDIDTKLDLINVFEILSKENN